MSVETIEDEPPAKPAPWPLTEEHRRKAAAVAAWAIDNLHGLAVGGLGGRSPESKDAPHLRDLAVFAETMARIAGPWSKP